MRWLTFILFGCVLISVQAGLTPYMEWRGARPDWVLAFILFYALNARSSDVLLGAWILGAILDLMTAGPFGLLSLSYGLAALFVYLVRESVFREKMGTQVAVTFIITMLVNMGIAVYRLFAFPESSGGMAALAGEAFRTALYTTAFAPAIFYFLHRGYWMLGLKTVGRGRI